MTALLDALALRALTIATELLGRAIGRRIAQMRESDLTHNILGAKIEEQALRIYLLQESNDILAARWQKIPERHRPHYTPEQRYRILRVKRLSGLSQKDTAHRFSVCQNTIGNWEKEASGCPNVRTVGSLVRPTPPLRRYADVARHLGQTMALCGFGGNGLIARTLARAGWRISKRTVGGIRKEKPLWPTPPESEVSVPKPRSVKARYPNHVWMSDLSEIPGFFRIFCFRVAVFFDVFSRMPLAAEVSRDQPTAVQIAGLLDHAVQRHGTPRHFVSDRGPQFTSETFRETLAKFPLRHRFGAVGKTGSIALIERFWRTLKEMLGLKSLRPLTLADLRKRLELGLYYYAYLRPHQGLCGATPAEIYFGLTPAHLSAVHPPRGRPGEIGSQCPFEIVHLDPERFLSVLLPKAA